MRMLMLVYRHLISGIPELFCHCLFSMEADSTKMHEMHTHPNLIPRSTMSPYRRTTIRTRTDHLFSNYHPSFPPLHSLSMRSFTS